MKEIKITAKSDIGTRAIEEIHKKYSKLGYRIALKKLNVSMLISVNDPLTLIIELKDKKFSILKKLPSEGKRMLNVMLEDNMKSYVEELDEHGAKKNIDYDLEIK